MKYIKKTLEYLFILEKGKRFISLALLSLPIGVATAFIMSDWVISDWLLYFNSRNLKFLEAWFYGNNVIQVLSFSAMFILAYACFVSIQTSTVSRSLRIGVFKTTSLFRDFNDSFFPTIYSLALYIVMFIVYRFVNAIFIVLWQNVDSVIASLVLTLLSLTVIFVIFIVGLSLTITFLPIMTFEGIKPAKALSLSVQKSGKHTTKIFLSLSIPILISIVANVVIGMLFKKLWILFLASSLIYSALACYIICLSMIIYCEIEQIKREDYPREYFFKRKS